MDAPDDCLVDLRRLRAVAAVAESGSVTHAAERLYLSQPALTRAVRELEMALGVALFERLRGGGMRPTAEANILRVRYQRVVAHMESISQEMSAEGLPSHLSRRLTMRHLEVIVALANWGSEMQAAQRLGLRQPALSRTLREVEQLADARLFLRTRHRMIATPQGEQMVMLAKLVLAELRYAHEELSSRQGQFDGRVVLGTLPLSMTRVAPLAIKALLTDHPALNVTTIDGTYEALLAGLRCGEIDLIIGALRMPAPADDVVEEPLFDDCLSVVVRADHPLTRKDTIATADLLAAEWVVARPGAPSRTAFEQVFAHRGAPLPSRRVEAGSLVTVRGLLLESDRLTLLSRHQISYEEQCGLLVALPLDLPETRRQIGISMRAHGAPPPGVLAMCRHLRAISHRVAGVPLTAVARQHNENESLQR